MKTSSYNLKVITFVLLMLGMASAIFAQSPKDTTKTSITILGSDYSEYMQSEGNTVQKLINNVKLLHGSDTLYCDSAFFFQTQNGFEAFGDVAIYQADGTEAFADYMRYTGRNKNVLMKGTLSDVLLTDNKGMSILSKEVIYNLGTKIGSYQHGGTLQSDATILKSRSGVYNMRTKEAVFQRDVDVNDPEYHVRSTHLGYNTETKLVRFLGPSVVTNDQSILQTSNGTYNSLDKIGHFVNRSSLLNEAQYIEADTLDYNRITGWGIAIGNVIALDTTQNSTLYCGKATYNEITKNLFAFQEPVMKTINDQDSLFIKADTFFSRPVSAQDSMSSQDSLQETSNILHGSVKGEQEGKKNAIDLNLVDSISPQSDSLKHTAVEKGMDSSLIEDRESALTSLPFTDSTLNSIPTMPENKSHLLKKKLDVLVYEDSLQLKPVLKDSLDIGYRLNEQQTLDSTNYAYSNRPNSGDTSQPRFFTAFHNVWIYSDSLQGRCDSLSYSQSDSMMRMFQKPVLWQLGKQITGTVIMLQQDKNKLKELIVPSLAIMISRSGPDAADMFDQVQGNEIRGYFKDNKLDSMVAEPNAESIYFIQDESDAYIGASEANSERLEIIFSEGKIKTIYYRTNVEQTMTPMNQVVPSALRLSRFEWRGKERPQSLKEFLEGRELPESPNLLKNLP